MATLRNEAVPADQVGAQLLKRLALRKYQISWYTFWPPKNILTTTTCFFTFRRTRAIPGYNPEKKSYGNFKSQPFAPQQGRMAASPKPAMPPANQANGMYAHDCAYDFEGPQCQPIQPQQPAQPNWLQAPPMGFLTPEQLGQETARNRPAITVKSPYARSSNSLSPGHSSSSGSINRSRAGESGPAPTKLLGIDWYWWAAVAGGFVLLIVFMAGLRVFIGNVYRDSC